MPTSRGILRRVQALQPLLADPARTGILCDVDGVLAPIVRRADEARVSQETALLLSRLARRYGLVACISGRSAADARRLVGVGGIAYAGSHGAEVLEPGAARPRWNGAFKSHEGELKRFADEATPRASAAARADRGQGPDRRLPLARRTHEAPRAHIEEIAAEAEAEGLTVHWARRC